MRNLFITKKGFIVVDGRGFVVMHYEGTTFNPEDIFECPFCMTEQAVVTGRHSFATGRIALVMHEKPYCLQFEQADAIDYIGNAIHALQVIEGLGPETRPEGVKEVSS